MKVSFKTEELREVLRKAQPFITTRGMLPILGGVRLQSSLGKSKAHLMATDLETSLSVDIPCIADELFDVTLPHRQSLRFLGKNNGTVSLESLKGATKLEIEHVGRVEFSDAKLPSDFPPAPKPYGDLIWTTQSKEFLRVLDFVATNAAREESRPCLSGVLFEEGGIAAADGFQLASYEPPGLTFGLGSERVILPAGSAFRLAKTFVGLEEFEMAFDGRQAFFRAQGMQMVSQLIQGTFPNYKQLVPTSFDHRASFSVPVLIDRLSMLDGRIARFVFHPHHVCEISMRDEALTTSYLVEMPANSYSKEDFRIAFSKSYVKNAVKLFSMCDFEMVNPSSPGVFKGDIEGLTVVIMPMFVQWL